MASPAANPELQQIGVGSNEERAFSRNDQEFSFRYHKYEMFMFKWRFLPVGQIETSWKRFSWTYKLRKVSEQNNIFLQLPF